MSALEQLAEFEAGVQAAHVRVREIEDASRTAASEAARLKEELTEAFAADDQQAATKLTKVKAKADARAAEPWDERIAGAKRAATRTGVERDQWMAEHYAELARKRQPCARAVVEAIESSLRAFLEGVRAWHAEEQEQINLLRPLPNQDGRTIPQLSVDELARQVKRALGEPIEPPVPRALQSWSIPPEHDPDPEIREAARAKVSRSARTVT